MSDWYCLRCGGNHPVWLHDAATNPDRTPLETPSHNGPYRGTLQVREIPTGISGSEWTNPLKYQISAGVARRFTHTCQWCEKEFTSNRKASQHLYCCNSCRARSNEQKAKKRKR